MNQYSTKKYPLWMKGSVMLLGIVLLYLVFSYGKFILMPLAISALIAMILEPFSQQIQKLKVGRIGAIILSMLIVSLLLAGIFSMLSLQFVQFVGDLPQANERLQSISSELLAFFQQTFGVTPERQVQFLQRSLQEMINRSGQYASAALGATTDIFTTLAILPFFIFFMMYYKNMYRTFLYEVWKGESKRSINLMIQRIQAVIQNYILGMLSVIVILALLNGLG